MCALNKDVKKVAKSVVIQMLLHMAVITCWVLLELKRMNLDYNTIIVAVVLYLSVINACEKHSRALMTALIKARY
jgi:hypothetical protein